MKSELSKLSRRLALILAARLAAIACRLAAFARADQEVVRANHIRTTTLIAGWPAETADLLIGRGVGEHAAAKMFATAPEHIQ